MGANRPSCDDVKAVLLFSAGGHRRLPAGGSSRRAAVLLLQQQERALGLPHREGLHEGDGRLRLPRLQLGETLLLADLIYQESEECVAELKV